MSIKANAVLFTAANQVEVGEVEVPSPGADEVLLEIDYSCISPGTDLRTLAGKQWGAKPWPFVPGYSQVGRIIEKGAKVSLELGTLVFSSGTKRCSANITWGAHISHAVAPAASVVPIPSNVDPLEASLAKLAAISYHGAVCSEVEEGDQVAVVGLGPIGLLSALFHQLKGGRVVAMDLSPERVAFARSLGLEGVRPEDGLVAEAKRQFENGPDIVVDSTGIEAVLRDCLEMGRELPWADHEQKSTRLLLQGSYPGSFSVDYREAFYRETRMVVSRDHLPRDIASVLALLNEEKVCIRDIITKVASWEDAPNVYEELRSGKGAVLTAALRWK